MTNFQTVNPAYSLGTGTPVYQPQVPSQPVMQPQNMYTQNITSPYYNYPTSSVYGANQNKPQQLSGVNIYIYNPSAIGGAPAVFTDGPQSPAAQTSLAPAAQTYIQNNNMSQPAPQPSTPPIPAQPVAEKNDNYSAAIASAPVKSENSTEKNTGKTKQITQLTDNYIRSLESYLKNPDSAIRQLGIKEMIKRFEEDESRFNNPALTALMNIALQDPDPNNRCMAMSPVAGGSAHGDDNTIALLQRLQGSDKLFGQEAQMASEALLKSAQEMITVPDNSPDKPEKPDKKEQS